MRSLIILALVWISTLTTFNISAHPQNNGDREQWMSEMRQYKRLYFVKELDLNADQKAKFFPIYEEMENKVAKINEDARQMEKRVAELPNATDLEYEKATEAMYDASVQSAQIEKEYAEKFRGILTPKQLFRLKAVERQFNRQLMQQHNRLRSKAKGDGKAKGERKPKTDKSK